MNIQQARLSTAKFCLYRIKHIAYGKAYIGVTKDASKRFVSYAHFNFGGQKHIYAAVHKDGWAAFRIDILYANYPYEQLLQLEQFEIKTQGTLRGGYNLTAGGGGTFRMKATPEQRLRNSQAHLGLTPGNKGKKTSEEVRKKLSIAHKGLPSGNKGNKYPIETRRKISERQKGIPKAPRTAEHCANLSKAQLGQKRSPLSEEHRRKVVLANKGRKVLPETRLRMSAARKQWHAVQGHKIS